MTNYAVDDYEDFEDYEDEYDYEESYELDRKKSYLHCPKCGSDDVSVEVVQTEMKNKNKGIGFGGHMNNAARMTTAICTFGISNLFWKKSEGTEQAKFKHQKMCVCQCCGNSWNIK